MNKMRTSNPLLITGILMVIILFVMAIFGPLLAPYGMKDQVNIYTYGNDKMAISPIEPFTFKKFFLGTDKWGYDLFSSVLYGARYTIFTAITIAFLKLFLGLGVGLFTGTMKRKMFLWESIEHSLSYIPAFLLIYFILLPISFNSNLTPITLVLIFVMVTSIIGFPSIAAIVREKTKQIYQTTFIEASVTSGSSKWKIIKDHIVPHLKEDIIVLFVLEIVSAITVMGQLALFNIFIGGTIVEFEPILYHSATKEWAGLVGQARANIWSHQFILFIPLAFLLYATVSFQLLAMGLKKTYDRRYNQGSWI